MRSSKYWQWFPPILFLVIMFSSFSKVESGKCTSHQFDCGNDRCIPIGWYCDEDNDCGDNADEDNCEARTCSETEFKCANSKCIPNRWLCDNEDDCGDISDESPHFCQNKTCAPNQFSCASSPGMCIPVTWRCDGQEDCPDGSDEKVDCQQITCTEEEFTCQNNKCITQTWFCDQDDDCGDGSDEKNCPNITCSTSEFMCSNGKCIPQRWFCDGDVDCFGSSDEMGCPDNTDTPCTNREFMCASRDCIHFSWVCDGDPDCSDGSDESNCTTSCRPDEFQCSNNKCILKTLRCNGISECGDSSDEIQCPKSACDIKTEFNCGENRCISMNKVCDGRNDCGDWKDEPGDMCHVNECKINNGGCSQKCIDTSAGYHCDCVNGYELVGNRTCEDINECLIPGSCSQLCDNTKGSFKCSCLPGYSIEPSNNHRCKAEQGHAVLLFANRHDIRRIDLETMEYTSVVRELRSAVALDYDFGSQTIFWSDIAEEVISSAPIATGSPIKTVAKDKIVTPDGIAVDWIYKNIYWTDTGRNTIEVADMSGKYRKILISQGLDEPRAIVINPLEGWMFWTDWGEPAKIERAGMDGTHRTVIVSTNIRWPNGLAIDFVTKKIYWGDAKIHSLSSADYDGKNQRVILISSTIVKHPFSVAVFEDWLFWSDWETESIRKVNKFTGKDLQDVGVSIYSPMDIYILHSYKQPPGQNYCAFPNGRCSHLCLPAPRLNDYSSKYSCACPTGMQLSVNMKTCFGVETTSVSVSTSNVTAPNESPKVFSSYPAPEISSTTKSFNNTSQVTMETITSSADNTSLSSQIPSFSNDSANASKMGSKENFVDVSGYENADNDTGRLAGIVIGTLSGLVCVLSVFGFCIYNHYLRRNVTSMNFDNPVYRKTTEDQFSLEKNQYQPARSYPPSLEPLTSPGTNEFV